METSTPKTTHNQLQSPLFKLLPPELRQSIYTHLLHPIPPKTNLHITENERLHRLSSTPCIAPPENSPGIQHRPTSDAQRRWESIHRACGVRRRGHWERARERIREVRDGRVEEIKSALASAVRLVVTCRRVYHEATPLLYTPLVFEITNLSTIYDFLIPLHSPFHSNLHTQHLDLSFTIRDFCTYPVRRTANHDFPPPEYSAENQRIWNEVCTAIKGMQLRTLRVRFYKAWGIRLVERELLEPLIGTPPGMSIQREDFVVELPKRSGDVRERELVDDKSAWFKVVRV